MRLGDILEWLAGVLLVLGVLAVGWHATALALFVAAIFLGYQAQCHAGTEFRIPRPRRKAKKTVPVP